MSQYIKLEDVQKLRNKVINRWGPNDTDMTRLAELSLFAEINSLPSINPEAMIKTMVDEKLNMMQDNPYFHPEMGIDFLEELLQKFKS